jgi:ketosteroid isomerase-like protein
LAGAFSLKPRRAEWADVLRVRNGKVTTLISYFDRDHALADLRLEG